MGCYISQDPIKIHGDFNIYSYVADSNDWLDLFGLAPWGRGQENFDKWWKRAKQKTIKKHIKAVKSHLRGPGGFHEMFPVAAAMEAKRLKFTPQELRALVLPTKGLKFRIDSETGAHHSSKISSIFHKKLIEALKKANTKKEALAIIENMHSQHVVGYAKLKK